MMVSSPRVVSVCPGKQLRLVCTVNHSRVLTWAITLPEINSTEPLMRNIPWTGMKNQIPFSLTPVTTFRFTRISEAEMLPLIAELLIDRVNTDLNETDVQCLPSNDSDPQTTLAINVLGGWWCELEIIYEHYHYNNAAEKKFHLPKVEMNELAFQLANFTVILNWIQEARVSYNISIDPLTELVAIMNSNNTWKVTAGSYNTPYNVSIEATLCDYSKITNIFLEYGQSNNNN
jgi:hypothetical protein